MSKQNQKTASGQSKRQNTVVFLCLAALVLTIAYVNVRGLVDSYVDSFIFRGEERAEAAGYLKGLDGEPTADWKALQEEWDNWRYSRLRDEATVTAAGGVTLHGYYYDEGGDTTAIFVPRYHGDGTADFLLASRLHERTGCNVLIIDPRTCGESGGDSFTYGYREAEDLVCWMDWAEETLGSDRFILCGEGAGANTILFAAAAGALEGRVDLVVAESPYGSFGDQARYTLKESYQIPAVPFYSMMESKVNRSDAGFVSGDLELAAALAGSSAGVPVLFLASGGDRYIPAEMTRAAFDAYPGEKTWITGGSAHGTVTAACLDEILSGISAHLG